MSAESRGRRMRPGRFVAVGTLCAAIYLLAALFGTHGPVRCGRWLPINQHLELVRSWLGEETGRHTLGMQPYDELFHGPATIARLDLAVLPPAPGTNRQRAHVGFPLGPAFLLLPLRLLLRGWLAAQWLSAVLGGLAVAALDALLALWLGAVATADPGSRSTAGPSRNPLVLLAGFGTLWFWIVPLGLVWHFAQTVATTGLVLAFLAAERGRWLPAGIAYGFAVTSRPSMALALPFFLPLLARPDAPKVAGGGVPPTEGSVHDGSVQDGSIQGGPVEDGSVHAGSVQSAAPSPAGWFHSAARLVQPWFRSRLLRFAVAPSLLVGAMLVLNQIRFGSPFEFGYRYMQTAPDLAARMRAHGLFSPVFLWDNIRWLILAPPVLVQAAPGGPLIPPWIGSHPMGMGIFFVTPAFLAAFLTLAPVQLRKAPIASAWAALALLTVPALLYYNTGWKQWGGRFLLDAWPFWIFLTAVGLRRLRPAAVWILVGLSVASNLWGTLATTIGWWPR